MHTRILLHRESVNNKDLPMAPILEDFRPQNLTINNATRKLHHLFDEFFVGAASAATAQQWLRLNPFLGLSLSPQNNHLKTEQNRHQVSLPIAFALLVIALPSAERRVVVLVTMSVA